MPQSDRQVLPGFTEEDEIIWPDKFRQVYLTGNDLIYLAHYDGGRAIARIGIISLVRLHSLLAAQTNMHMENPVSIKEMTTTSMLLGSIYYGLPRQNRSFSEALAFSICDYYWAGQELPIRIAVFAKEIIPGRSYPDHYFAFEFTYDQRNSPQGLDFCGATDVSGPINMTENFFHDEWEFRYPVHFGCVALKAYRNDSEGPFDLICVGIDEHGTIFAKGEPILPPGFIQGGVVGMDSYSGAWLWLSSNGRRLAIIES